MDKCRDDAMIDSGADGKWPTFGHFDIGFRVKAKQHRSFAISSKSFGSFEAF